MKKNNLFINILLFDPIYMLIKKLFCFANKKKYEALLFSKPYLKLSVSKDWVRIPMYASIDNFFSKLSKKRNVKNMIVLEIGGSEGSIKKILEKYQIKNYIASNYPHVDIHNLPYKNSSYDIIVTDQVFEHIQEPWHAVDEIYRVLKRGGISVNTGPFMIGYHGNKKYKDYYRFTPDGWKDLFNKFDILVADGWGNNEVIKLSLNSSVINSDFGRTIAVDKILRKKILEKNDHANYLLTWCIARKI